MRSRKRSVRILLVGSALAAAVATAAWALSPLLQPATLLDSGGERLTGDNVVSTVTLGESLVGPLEMTGPGVIMRPGFLAKKKALQADVPTSVDEPPVPLPSATHLGQSFPNPFSTSTTVRFGLAETAPVALHVYDASGRMVREVTNAPMSAGFHELSWDGTTRYGDQAPSGVYFLRMSTPNFSDNKKVILSR